MKQPFKPLNFNAKNVIETQGLTKYFKDLKALDNVNLEIPRGRIIGLLGKNGAGKSTLMRCMLGFLKYTGEIRLFETKLKSHNESIHNHIAFIPDVSSLDDRLTVQQTMEYVAGLNSAWNEVKAEKLLLKSRLPKNKKVGKLSKGMKTKLYLLITLSLDVKVLLLDEPTLGLDIEFRKNFFNTILGEFYDANRTIIISTHQVEEVEHILQDIIFIDDGKIVLYDEVEKLKNSYHFIEVPNDRKDELMKLNPLTVNHSLGKVGAIIKEKINIEGAEYSRPSLSDLFLAKCGGKNE